MMECVREEMRNCAERWERVHKEGREVTEIYSVKRLKGGGGSQRAEETAYTWLAEGLCVRAHIYWNTHTHVQFSQLLSRSNQASIALCVYVCVCVQFFVTLLILAVTKYRVKLFFFFFNTEKLRFLMSDSEV